MQREAELELNPATSPATRAAAMERREEPWSPLAVSCVIPSAGSWDAADPSKSKILSESSSWELGVGLVESFRLWDVLGISKPRCFLSAILQNCGFWQEWMDVEQRAVVAAPESGPSRPGGDRVCSTSCWTILPAARRRAIRVPQSVSLCFEL